MGRHGEFRRPLTRKPIPAWTRYAAAGGGHKGIRAPNVPWEIAVACTSGETVDVATYVRLHTEIDLDGLYDLLELQQMQDSWRHAAIANQRERMA